MVKSSAKPWERKPFPLPVRSGAGRLSAQISGADRQALPDDQIIALARLGQQAAVSFGGPQDMEWSWADGQLYVVQSRPVTSLYPLPPAPPDNTLEIMMSFGVWQGMLDPYTPIGQDVFRYVITGFIHQNGGFTTPLDQRIILIAGERIFINLTQLLQTPVGAQYC